MTSIFQISLLWIKASSKGLLANMNISLTLIKLLNVYLLLEIWWVNRPCDSLWCLSYSMWSGPHEARSSEGPLHLFSCIHHNPRSVSVFYFHPLGHFLYLIYMLPCRSLKNLQNTPLKHKPVLTILTRLEFEYRPTSFLLWRVWLCLERNASTLLTAYCLLYTVYCLLCFRKGWERVCNMQ